MIDKQSQQSRPPILDDSNNFLKNTFCDIVFECFLSSKYKGAVHTPNIFIEVIPQLEHRDILQRCRVLYNNLCLVGINELIDFGNLVFSYRELLINNPP